MQITNRMSDFDWNGTLAAVHGAGHTEAVLAGQVSDGVAYASYPLGADGNYQFWVYSDAYKATITKEKGKEVEEVEEDVYETYNLACLLVGAKTDATFTSQGVRINATKYTVLRELENQTYTAKIDDGSGSTTPYPVTLEKVFILKSRENGMLIGVKGGYYFAARYKSDPRSDPSLTVADDVAIGFYWAVGPDA